tara:strand:- start:1327 stop:1506 length:180 start_codon:yes stop_codon:yes gene_type:complete
MFRCLNEKDFSGVFKVTEAKGNQLATISVYLNTPIIAVLLGVGFIVGSILFAGILLIAR